MNDREVESADDGQDGPDEIAELIRLAGKRPAVPLDEIDRIRSATHARWKESVQSRSGRRAPWVSAALLAAAVVIVAVGVWVWRLPPSATLPAPSLGTVQAMVGTSWITEPGAGEPHPLVAGGNVSVPSELRTSDGARLSVRLPTGHSVRIDSASRLRVVSRSTLGLEDGAVYVDSGSQAVSEPVTILTRAGEIQELGTQFEARLQGTSLHLRVREGSVSLGGTAGRFEVAAGQVLEVAEDGSVVRGDVAPSGSEWAWIEDVTPMMEVEGRPLREFLAWAARERGWALTFADAGTSDRAGTIILSGSIEGLTLDQALDAVLRTSSLTRRVEHGVLVIE